MRLLTLIFLLAFLENANASLTDFQTRCNTLSQGVGVKAYNGVSVTIVEYLTQNTTIDQFSEGTNTTCALPNPIVPVNLCRLALHVPTSESSETYMEAWLPEKWNARFIAVGTGGLAGCIFYQDLAYVAARGFASVSSNSGHNGTSAGAFFHQPEVFKDFVWRALYATTIIGKDITRQLYGTPHKKSYFLGCSQGGRQGFKAAQTNPELFDGIIAGAPGLKLPGLFQHATRWLRTIGTDADNLTVSLEKWSAIQSETLRQCDSLDGIADGFIEDTRKCNPSLSKLQCGNPEASEPCLTSQELSLVAQFFKPWYVNNTLIYPGMVHNGGEVAHATTLSSLEFLNYAFEWPRFVSRQDLDWTTEQWTPADALLALQQNFFGFNTWDGDLSKFRNKGGKILHYHGQLDQSIDSKVSDQYYEHVSRTLRASPTEIDQFYRYFRISGMGHCTGGPGASGIGQNSFPPPASESPDDNVLSRIVEWVENGNAPDTVRGTKYKNDDAAQGIELQRRHCKYPARNIYSGNGDGKDEEGWQCVD